MDIKINDRCVLHPKLEKDFTPFKTSVKNVKNNLLEIKTVGKSEIFQPGKNFVIEVKKTGELKKYKAKVEKSEQKGIVCSVQDFSEKDREFKRVDSMIGTSFRVWNERMKLNMGICTNISGNGMVITGDVYANLGELVLIEKVKLDDDFRLEGNITGRVIKFISGGDNADEYNRMIVDFVNIKKSDRMSIINFVNTTKEEDLY